MTVYKAYDIADSVSVRESLSAEQISNIEVVIKMVLDNLPTTKVFYQVPKDRISDKNHPVVQYNKNVFNKSTYKEKRIIRELDNLANKLLFEEQIEEKDGNRRRNKKIKEGLLFAKHTEDRLILLKFEETKIIDKATFKPIEGLSIDKQYYKIVVIQKNEYEDMMIVDRNKVVAKYWASGFLELERQRDSFVNTTDLLNFLEEDTLINKAIKFTDEEYIDIKHQVKDLLFESKSFDKDEIFSSLIYDKKVYNFGSEDFFEPKIFDVIDSVFILDKEAISKKYSKTIKVSDSSKVVVNNLYNELKRETIEIKGNKMIMTIDSAYKENVQNMLKSVRENV